MMRYLVIILLLLVSAVSSLAQFIPDPPPPPQYRYQPRKERSLDELIAARTKLILWYVLSSSNYAWGVSVCGSDDVLNGAQHSWLTIYVYRDSLTAFTKDFKVAATRETPNGPLGVDGVTVVVEVVERRKH